MAPESSLLCSQEPSTSPILSDINPANAPTLYLFKIHFSIIHPPVFMTSNVIFSIQVFYNKNFINIHLFVGDTCPGHLAVM